MKKNKGICPRHFGRSVLSRIIALDDFKEGYNIMDYPPTNPLRVACHAWGNREWAELEDEFRTTILRLNAESDSIKNWLSQISRAGGGVNPVARLLPDRIDLVIEVPVWYNSSYEDAAFLEVNHADI